MTKVAVLADSHGNLPALEVVLAEVETAGVDLIVLNGDLADGPFPAETLDRLIALGKRAIWLRGNGDRWLFEECDGTFGRKGDATCELLQWASACITRYHRDLLAVLPLTSSITLSELGRIGFCHATPRSDNEMFLVDSPLSQYREAFSEFEPEAVFVGHCHMPLDRLFDRRRVINTGSAGVPYGHYGTSWALIDRDIVLRRTMYDVEDAADRVIRTQMPSAHEFIQTYILNTPSDDEALHTFHGIMQAQQDTDSFD